MSYELSPKAKAFIEAIVSLESQYGLTLGHEDHEGAFVVHDFNEENVEWLRDASDKSGQS